MAIAEWAGNMSDLDTLAPGLYRPLSWIDKLSNRFIPGGCPDQNTGHPP